jgi:hypothetical protein
MKKELCCHQQQRRHKYCTIDEESRTESLSDGLSSIYDDNDSVESKASIPESELALSGILAQDTREILQQKLAAVLHALAAAYDDVGYCQGVDYVVCHLMRIMQDTIVALAKSCRLPSSHANCSTIPAITSSSSNNVVEETLFHVMDCFFSYYNLKHMYWPELRFLKRTCQVFQRLIERKLPVLADHFEHHELNVSLFALGWFQTLFLYIPSMPTATVSFLEPKLCYISIQLFSPLNVLFSSLIILSFRKQVCHIWDIWLVERSFKIFFRVGTAILLLSQPTLLNQELEGMMTYLNTFPDATLLCPDILMECALSIKVTNRMLVFIENELLSEGLIF